MQTLDNSILQSELVPLRQALQTSLMTKDLHNCKLTDLTEIMLPMDSLLALFKAQGQPVLAAGVDFINDLLGQIGTEAIPAPTGLSYVLNLYENLELAMDAWCQGEDAAAGFAPVLAKFKAMFEGPKTAQAATAEISEEVLQDLPNADILEDGSVGDFINEVTDGLQSVEETVMELEAEPGRRELVDAVFRVMHTIKGTSGFLGMPVIGKVAHRTEDILGEVRDAKRTLGSNVFELLFVSIDTLKNLVDQMKTRVEGGSAEPVNIGKFYRTLQICLDNPSGDMPDQAWDMVSAEAGPAETAAGTAQPATAAPALGPGPKKAEPPRKAAKIEEMLKVSASKLDELSGLVGEMVVALSLLTQNPVMLDLGNRSVNAQLDHLDKITESLRDKVLGIRMFPIGSVFSKLSRQVRDLSQKSGKKIELVLQGADTLVDKSIIDNIYAPLMHLVRNSIDHGIEPPEERAPKPKTGYVTLSAQHLGDAIELMIQDDGKGLDREKLLDKAVEKGLARRDKEYTESEVFNFIFLPGFSTAKQVTDISGRGVGMDVVRKTVEQLRGKVITESAKGVGTSFRLKLPLTTSIIEGLVVSVAGSRFILPILDVNQTITPEEQDLKGFQGHENEFFLLAGETVPIVRLYELYHLTPKVVDPAKSVVIVCNVATKKYGIMVDELLHRQQIVIQNLGERFAQVKGITGGTILGDGRVGLILDPVSLINELYSHKKHIES